MKKLWKPGESGNPSGRPPKNRALTEILEKAGNVTIEVAGEDKKTARKRVVAETIWQLISVGKATLPDGKILELDPQDWLGLVKWIYTHIDGPPKAGVDVNNSGDLTIRLIDETKTDAESH